MRKTNQEILNDVQRFCEEHFVECNNGDDPRFIMSCDDCKSITAYNMGYEDALKDKKNPAETRGRKRSAVRIAIDEFMKNDQVQIEFHRDTYKETDMVANVLYNIKSHEKYPIIVHRRGKTVIVTKGE